MGKGLKLAVAFAAVVLMAATAALAASDRSQAKDTFVVGAEGDPILLDG